MLSSCLQIVEVCINRIDGTEAIESTALKPSAGSNQIYRPALSSAYSNTLRQLPLLHHNMRGDGHAD
jgi:hypothetical protein